MLALRTIRRRLLAIVAVLALAPATASAAQPEFYTRYDDVTIDDPFLTPACGFPVVAHFEGAVKGRNFYDKEGNLVRSFETYSHRYLPTFTNPATGTSFTSSAPAVFRYEYHEDGTFTFTVTGLQDNITVPGEGSMFRDAGKIVIEGGDITFEAGRHDEFRLFVLGETQQVQELCEALAA